MGTTVSKAALHVSVASGSGVKFALGTDLGSASSPPILTLTISGGNAKLTQDQCQGATSPYSVATTVASPSWRHFNGHTLYVNMTK